MLTQPASTVLCRSLFRRIISFPQLEDIGRCSGRSDQIVSDGERVNLEAKSDKENELGSSAKPP